MEHVAIKETDTVKEMAEKIFYHFLVHQSCTIIGVEASNGSLDAKGALVWNEIKRLDEKENMVRNKQKLRRKRKLLPNSIGGYVAQKIFLHDYKIQEDVLRYTIWRYQ